MSFLEKYGQAAAPPFSASFFVPYSYFLSYQLLLNVLHQSRADAASLDFSKLWSACTRRVGDLIVCT